MSTRALVALPCALSALALLAPPARTQETDYTVDAVRVLQIIEPGAMVADRPVTVRAMIKATGPLDPPQGVDGILRVYVDGVEAEDSPVFSMNGPLSVTQNSKPAKPGTMLNFTYVPPASNDVVFEVQLNPPGPHHVPEAFLSNNTTATGSLAFEEQELLTLMYSPIDHRPGGGTTPNLPPEWLILPGVGDAFVQGIYPGNVIEYRRTDAPSKLWTGSLSSSGSALNSSLGTDLLLTVPQPDFIYGWVNGSLPYNGMAFIGGVAAMGNTDQTRSQRTYAHELGHNFGQSHNSFVTGVWGEDVERHLWVPEALTKVKDNDLLDIMVAGQLTKSAWVHPSIYEDFYNHPDLSLPLTPPGADEGWATRLLVAGRWDRLTGEVTLDPVLAVDTEHGTRPAAPGRTDLVITGLVGGDALLSVGVTARTTADEAGCAEPAPGGTADAEAQPFEAVVPFVALIPAAGPDGRALDGLVVTGTGSHPLVSSTRGASAHAPQVALLAPTGHAQTGAEVTVRWTATDADGDALAATLRYLPDGDASHHAVPLVTHTAASETLVDLRGLPQFVSGQGCFELLVSDGFRTTRVRSEPLRGNGAWAGAGGELPWVQIYHPDDATNYSQGARLILHSSGWDLEDHALDGASITWSSDLDGALGSGRRFTRDDLSVGTHAITVTATDSAGQQSMATHMVTIDPRQVPDPEGEICAVDLGLGGPGSSSVSLCGGPLWDGGSADLLLVDGPPSTLAYLALGLTYGAVPIKGGTLVPFPWAALIDLSTNASGAISIPGVTGTGVHFDLYLQFVLVDGAQPAGVGFSNALRAEF